MTKPIPKEVAINLCEQIRKQNTKKIFSLAKWQCWGCLTFTKGDPSKMCFSGKKDNRGCNLVNTAFDK